MITIKRMLYSDQRNFSWFSNLSLGFQNINTDPITMKEMAELDKKYPGFVKDVVIFRDNGVTSNGKLKTEKIGELTNGWFREKIINGKLKLLGARKITDCYCNTENDKSQEEVSPYFYFYFDTSTEIANLDKHDYYWDIDSFIEMVKSKQKSNTPSTIKFLGQKINFEDGFNFFKRFDIKKLERRVQNWNIFYKEILKDPVTKQLIPNITENNIKGRLDIEVYWDDGQNKRFDGTDSKLEITFFDKKSDFYWTFVFINPDDPIEVAYTGD